MLFSASLPKPVGSRPGSFTTYWSMDTKSPGTYLSREIAPMLDSIAFDLTTFAFFCLARERLQDWQSGTSQFAAAFNLGTITLSITETLPFGSCISDTFMRRCTWLIDTPNLKCQSISSFWAPDRFLFDWRLTSLFCNPKWFAKSETSLSIPQLAKLLETELPIMSTFLS